MKHILEIQELKAENLGLKRQVRELTKAFNTLITQLDQALKKLEQQQEGEEQHGGV